jgi:glutamate dehydrogenase
MEIESLPEKKPRRHLIESEEDKERLYPDSGLLRKIRGSILENGRGAWVNLDWLIAQMPSYFFITMKEEADALSSLAINLHRVREHRQVQLVDQEKKYIVARLDIPGSLYDTLKTLEERQISYAELTHSYGNLPGIDKRLEIQRYEFDRKTHEEIKKGPLPKAPVKIKRPVAAVMRMLYPDYDFHEFEKDLGLLLLNNEDYLRISPAERIARSLWLCQQGRKHDGLYLDVEETAPVAGRGESRILFSVGNPKDTGFMTQVSEVFRRLRIGVQRSYSLNISLGIHRYFLGTFYVLSPERKTIQKDSKLFRELKSELYNTQILSTSRTTYKKFVANRMMTGEEASLANALVAFCHTTLAHTQPDRFDLDSVKSAINSDPDMTLWLVKVFKAKFDPDLEDGRDGYTEALARVEKRIEAYHTGHQYFDEIRKTIFNTCTLFIRHTLKTNFFVPEKHALVFRLDPAYLRERPDFTSDLPHERPFRITFFFGRYGIGYHIGFSEIARGGWRTIISTTHDEYITNTNTLFREVFVLAHTQHLKNKDIYEGGSKMTVVLDAAGLDSPDAVSQRLYNLQFGFINAFLDIFTTQDGKAKHPRVIDYFLQDEPIELGPDENMHDEMIELIAQQAVKRGYILGIGIMSSKRAGINHKEYGVTSRGVIKFAEIAMGEAGIDIFHDPFSVKITGGTNGDVAGNAMKLLLAKCPRVNIRSIVAGTGALYDPEGVDHGQLSKLLLKSDVVDFDPQALHPGGYILFRSDRRQEGLRELYRKRIRRDFGVEEKWVTTDEFYMDLDALIFETLADLFLPCGGRPETINETNWRRLFDPEGKPTARVIAEGANSFITPEARAEIQRRGIVVIRDASANKCGVISSSYEIIANLLMTQKEFLRNKDAYVRDVLQILDKRSQQEARLIFKRYNEQNGKMLYTEISIAISKEINAYYGRLFDYFQQHCELCEQPLFRQVLLSHLPAFIRETPRYRGRVKDLPRKIKYAILASEIASTIVYEGGWDLDLGTRLVDYVKQKFA